MTRTTSARSGAAAIALLATTFGGAVALVETSASAQPAPPQAVSAQAKGKTTLTYEIPGCDGCEVQLHQGLDDGEPGDPKIWHSKIKEVEGGTVSFTVRRKRTAGMSTTVKAPWEGHTGYVTTVALRYGGNGVGEKVTFKEARKKKYASACWEGTRSEELTLPVRVRPVMVDGVHERVKGSIAFLRETTSWLSPMRRAYRGVLGSQDVDICR